MLDLPLHAKLVHFPLAFSVLLPPILAGVAFAVWRGWLTRRAWWIAVSAAILTALSALAALRAGEADAPIVGRVVPREALEAHELAAQWFLVLLAVVAIAAIVAAFVRDKRAAVITQGVALLFAVAAMLAGVRTGHLGGVLVYGHDAPAAFIAREAERGAPLEGARARGSTPPREPAAASRDGGR